MNSSITTSFGSLFVKSLTNKLTANSEIIKIATKKNKNILSKKNNCIPNVVYISAKNKKRKRGFKINKKIVKNLMDYI